MKTMKEWFIANLGSIGKCPVFFDLLWSICVFIVVEHSTGHAGVHCLRPIEKNLELLPSICPKIMQNILSLLLFSDKYILSSPQEHCFWTVHKGNQAYGPIQVLAVFAPIGLLSGWNCSTRLAILKR